MLKVTLPRREFKPGEIISGRVEWADIERPESMDVRLIWYTEGKGDRDVGIVLSEVLNQLEKTGNSTFEFTAPAYPHSFSGTLISLVWAVECVMFPGRDADAVPLVIGPNRQELVATESHGGKKGL